MKQKDISQQLGSLINQTAGVYTTVPVDDIIPSELEQPAPLFEIDHDEVMKKHKTNAFITINYIMKSVIPSKYHNDEMIKNKMMLDAEQLAMLYYQQTINRESLKSAVDTLAKGDTQPRMYEVIEKMQKRAADLSNQVTDLQNQFRKYYIDTYLDIQSREAADEQEDELMRRSSGKNQEYIRSETQKKIAQKNDDEGVLITSPAELREKLDSMRIAEARKKLAEQKAQDIEFEEVKK